MSPEVPESSTGLPPRLAAVLAYGGWWVTGLIFWLVERRDRFVRFHAAQSIAAFGLTALIVAGFGLAALLSLSMLPTAFSLFVWASGLTWLVGMLVWGAALWQAAHGRTWRMPLAGQLADRMLSGKEP
jgi:uncharacterized membrane protein